MWLQTSNQSSETYDLTFTHNSVNDIIKPVSKSISILNKVVFLSSFSLQLWDDWWWENTLEMKVISLLSPPLIHQESWQSSRVQDAMWSFSLSNGYLYNNGFTSRTFSPSNMQQTTPDLPVLRTCNNGKDWLFYVSACVSACVFLSVRRKLQLCLCSWQLMITLSSLVYSL